MGWSAEEPAEWILRDALEGLPPRGTVKFEGRPFEVRARKYEAKGINGFTVPVSLLDCDLPNYDMDLGRWLGAGVDG